jgi:hypothetical protein
MMDTSSLRGAKRRSNPFFNVVLDCFASLAMMRLTHASGYFAASRSAWATSSGVLTLKNGSRGTAGHSATASLYRALHSPTLRAPSLVSARRKSSRRAAGQSAMTGWRRPPEAAGNRRAGIEARLMQTRHQIARQKRAIARRADDPADLICALLTQKIQTGSFVHSWHAVTACVHGSIDTENESRFWDLSSSTWTSSPAAPIDLGVQRLHVDGRLWRGRPSARRLCEPYRTFPPAHSHPASTTAATIPSS